MNLKRGFILLLFGFFLLSNLSAQKVAQVVTKTIKHTLAYEENDQLEIIAEKASIEISASNQDEIKLIIHLISKHSDLVIAKSEIDYLQFDVSKEGKKHVLKNYFSQPNSAYRAVKGNLKVKYEIRVPKRCNIVVTNIYGTLTVRDLSASLVGNSHFVETELTNLTGKIELNALFGKTAIYNCTGTLIGSFQKTDLNVTGFQGDINLESSLGHLSIQSDQLSSLKVKAESTEVNFLTSMLEIYNYDLKTTFSKVEFPTPAGSKPENMVQEIFDNQNPLIFIRTSYSPIQVKTVHHVTNN